MEPKVPEKPVVRWLGGTHYSVSSRTRPGRVHHVDTYHLTCSCEAGSWGKRCHALHTALLYEAWRRNEQSKADAARQKGVMPS
jgi:hypothetical protein